MANFTDISNQLKTLVQGVQQGGSAAFAAVYDYSTNQFSGFPAATIVPADVQSQWATVNQNRRTYAFEVDLWVSIANPGDVKAEFAIMRDLVDNVLDAFEKSIDLNGVVNFLLPVPMRWEVMQTGSGDLLVAPIRVMAEKDVVLF